MGIDPVSIAITLALNAATMAMTASQSIEGPRVTDLSVTVADYGTPLNYFMGKRVLQPPCFYAEPITEIKSRTKTKGGKYNGYSYFGTWAVAIADNEIESVLRIWFDKHLVFDATAGGPTTVVTVTQTRQGKKGPRTSSINLTDHFRVYYGTETQEPDPRMVTYIEARDGADTPPAYRGVAYLMFEGIPLEKFGNRLPQVSVEAVTASSPIYPYDITTPTIDPPNNLDSFHFAWSPDRSRFMWTDDDGFEIWDTATRTNLVQQSSWHDFGFTSATGMAISSSGTIYGIANPSSLSGRLVSYNSDGVAGAIIGDLFDGINSFGASDLVICRSASDGTEIVGIKPWSNLRGLAYCTLGAGGLYLDTGPLAWQPTSFFADLDGDVWAVGCYQSDTILVFQRVHGSYSDLPDYFEVAGMPTAQGAVGNVQAFHYRDADVDHFVICWNDTRLIAIDLATQSVTITQTISTIPAATYIESVQPGDSVFWIDGYEFSSIDLTVIRFLSDTDLATMWVSASSISGTFYDPISNALVSSAVSDGTLTWRYLDRINSDGVTLRSIVENISERVGIADADLDATDLTQVVNGFSWTQAQAKQILSPLLELYDADGRPHDFGIQFLNRG
jgi:hypothetical protein